MKSSSNSTAVMSNCSSAAAGGASSSKQQQNAAGSSKGDKKDSQQQQQRNSTQLAAATNASSSASASSSPPTTTTTLLINLDEIFEKSFHYFVMRFIRRNVANRLFSNSKDQLITNESFQKLIDCFDQTEAKYRGFMMNVILQLFDAPDHESAVFNSLKPQRSKSESDILRTLIQQSGRAYKDIHNETQSNINIEKQNKFFQNQETQDTRRILGEIQHYTETSMELCSKLPLKNENDFEEFGQTISKLIHLLKVNKSRAIVNRTRGQNRAIISLLRRIRIELANDDKNCVNNKALEMILALLYILLELYCAVRL